MSKSIAKQARFLIEVDGLDQFLAQNVTIGDLEISEIMVGQGIDQPDAKIPGKVTIGDVEVQKLIPTDSMETWAWDWLLLALTQNRETYARDIVFKLLGDNQQVIRTYVLFDAWPKTINLGELDRVGEDKVMETVTLAVSNISIS